MRQAYPQQLLRPRVRDAAEGLNEILGEEVVFDSQDEAREIVGMLMRHWNTIAAALQRTLTEREVQLPLLLEDDMPAATPVRRSARKVGRNEAGPCGSGRKYKHCFSATLR